MGLVRDIGWFGLSRNRNIVLSGNTSKRFIICLGHERLLRCSGRLRIGPYGLRSLLSLIIVYNIIKFEIFARERRPGF
jgi:hypothetical protein